MAGDRLLFRADLRKVSFDYGPQRVLDDITISLFGGEIACLLGPNGAGKSTLVKLICGLAEPTNGVLVFEPPIRAGAIALVPQNVALFPWLTAAENCMAFARLTGLSRRDARDAAERALTLTDCNVIRDVAVRRLSGGFQRRVNIAVALVDEPALLVLDEPTVGVDLEARAHVATILRRLRDRGAAVLLVTHDFAEVDGVAERLVFLESGRLAAWGTPASLAAWAFDGRKQLDILLRAPPDAKGRPALERFGAVCRTADGTSWRSFEDMNGWDTGEIANRLDDAGIPFSELRLRAPGAEALYNAFCGVPAKS